MGRYTIPVVVIGLFLVLVGFLYVGLDLNPREVPSPLIGKPAPDFDTPTLKKADARITLADLQDRVWILNVWASWCVSCRQEHPLLVEISQRYDVPIYGLNYKDKRSDALGWLARLGDPYTRNIFDLDGRVGLDWGVYGVPETFIVDGQGMIRHKHTGPVRVDDWQNTLWPLIQQIRQEAS